MINLVYSHYQFFIEKHYEIYSLDIIDLCDPEKEIYLTYRDFTTEQAAVDYACYRIRRMINQENKKNLEELRLNYKQLNKIQAWTRLNK